MQHSLDPNEAQFAKLRSLPLDTPLAVLNLFAFKDVAAYQPGDPEYGTPAAEISGQEAFARYGETAGRIIQELGGRIAFNAAADQVLIGPEDPDWHVAAIMYFPSRGAFLEMMANPDFQQASRHRKAAMKNHHMIHLNGEAFKD
ncbi:MAG: DUF1330 domain-containing protein [Pseudomonadota bacterium]